MPQIIYPDMQAARTASDAMWGPDGPPVVSPPALPPPPYPVATVQATGTKFPLWGWALLLGGGVVLLLALKKRRR